MANGKHDLAKNHQTPNGRMSSHSIIVTPPTQKSPNSNSKYENQVTAVSESSKLKAEEISNIPRHQNRYSKFNILSDRGKIDLVQLHLSAIAIV